MVRVATLCLLSGALACGGAASKPEPKEGKEEGKQEAKAETKPKVEPEAAKAEGGTKVQYPELPPRGTLALSGTGGAWKDATFSGGPAQETFSKQAGTVYAQTTPKAEGEKPLTYSFKRAITSLSEGEHAVRDGFTVYGLNGGLESYTFSGNVNVKTIDATAGVFEFVYVGSLALDGNESAVEGGVNIQVPVSD